MPMTRGTAGMNADPNCRRQEIDPVFCLLSVVANYEHVHGLTMTARLATVPRKMPNAVLTKSVHVSHIFRTGISHQICQDMTSPPRTLAGTFSAEKTGTVTSLSPIPTPRSTRQTASSPHVWLRPIPKGAKSEKTAAMKMVPRRPQSSFTGSRAISEKGNVK